jgi:GT2 family glycosyltransferase
MSELHGALELRRCRFSPAYTGERFLRTSLDSILAQSYRPNEILLMDDASTDGTEQSIRSRKGIGIAMRQYGGRFSVTRSSAPSGRVAPTASAVFIRPRKSSTRSFRLRRSLNRVRTG